MTLERDIKEALRRHEADAQPAPGAWREVERRVARSHRRRLTLATISGVAAIAAAAVAIPRLGAERAPDFSAPEPTASATETSAVPDPRAAWDVYRDDRAGFRFRVPADWRVLRFEGVTEAVPPGLQGSIWGEPTFSIAIEPTARAGLLASGEAPGAEWGRRTDGERDARRYSTWTRSGPGEQTSSLTLFDWPAAPDADGSPCAAPEPCPDSGLQVIVTASTRALADAHEEVAREIVATIAPPSAPGLTPVGLRVRTPRGSVSPATPYDDATSTLVLFLESRVEGAGAERYLTEAAARQFTAHEGGLGLYGSDPDTAYFRYEVVERAAVDASSFEYTIRLTAVAGDSQWVVEETLGVGPGDSPRGQGTAIRFAVLVSRTP